MILQMLAVSKDYFGLFDVTVRVDDKREYTFVVRSQHEVDAVIREMRYKPGKALNMLKKGNVMLTK
jgi:hypothetical protein